MFLHTFTKFRIVKSVSSRSLPELRAGDARGDHVDLQRKFDDAKTADHDVLSGENEHRLQHRYAAVVRRTSMLTESKVTRRKT